MLAVTARVCDNSDKERLQEYDKPPPGEGIQFINCKLPESEKIATCLTVADANVPIPSSSSHRVTAQEKTLKNG